MRESNFPFRLFHHTCAFAGYLGQIKQPSRHAISAFLCPTLSPNVKTVPLLSLLSSMTMVYFVSGLVFGEGVDALM